MRPPKCIRRLLDVKGADRPHPRDQPPPPRKPRVRVRPDGWIRHVSSDFPFAAKTVVTVLLESGVTMTDYAEQVPEQWWRGVARSWLHNVTFYRIKRWPAQSEWRVLGEGENLEDFAKEYRR